MIRGALAPALACMDASMSRDRWILNPLVSAQRLKSFEKRSRCFRGSTTPIRALETVDSLPPLNSIFVALATIMLPDPRLNNQPHAVPESPRPWSESDLPQSLHCPQATSVIAFRVTSETVYLATHSTRYNSSIRCCGLLILETTNEPFGDRLLPS